MLLRFVSWVFVVVFLFAFVGEQLLVFKQIEFARKEIKAALKASIPQNQLVSFTFDKAAFASLNWQKKDKEFRLGQSLYDIVSKEQRGDSIVLNCINDKQEEKLFAQLNDLIGRQLESKEVKYKNLKGKKLYTRCFTAKLLEDLPFKMLENNLYGSHVLFYNNWPRDVDSPPPEIKI